MLSRTQLFFQASKGQFKHFFKKVGKKPPHLACPPCTPVPPTAVFNSCSPTHHT